jgi:hypothetical protein
MAIYFGSHLVGGGLDEMYPIGCFYTQYPEQATGQYSLDFPANHRPQALFGGTWEAKFETEKIFFRTGGTQSAESDRTNGKQGDAIRNITGRFAETILPDKNDGAFMRGDWVRNWGGGGGDYNKYYVNFDASRVVPTAEENRPVNRRIIVWQRTA